MYKSIRKKVWAFHENEDGNMTLVNVMVVAWLLLMFAFNFNSQRIIETRTKTQLAADVAAASVGDKAADNMKELVALNHTIGTLLSKVLIHESWGGPGLDVALPQTLKSTTSSCPARTKPTFWQLS